MNMIELDLVNLNYELSADTTVSGRFYSIPGGGKYPSITTILGAGNKSWLADWRKRIGGEAADKIMRQAARRGTIVHDTMEAYVRGKEINERKLMPHNRASYRKLKRILDKKLSKVLAIEAALYSDHLRAAGRVDMVGIFDGKRSIIDFKTSRSLKEKEWITGYFIQTAAYAIMFEERTGIAIPYLQIVMDVDGHDPVVFTEKRDNWVSDLKSAIKEYETWAESNGTSM